VADDYEVRICSSALLLHLCEIPLRFGVIAMTEIDFASEYFRCQRFVIDDSSGERGLVLIVQAFITVVPGPAHTLVRSGPYP
jgi:hypothetical protein